MRTELILQLHPYITLSVGLLSLLYLLTCLILVILEVNNIVRFKTVVKIMGIFLRIVATWTAISILWSIAVYQLTI